ncbi:hypothetical protein A2276_02015 [candidate division WOR-1 bacterium RIFOXYA12_FULL_43_27]|uniref:DNA-binding response regulator n=1 Tax=candidate division WOR-1 bacterium RIFOXYC2_FULL_46_14 TaxID=1802587 RepID=A0A1F4U6G7_UNCSA|nr:MAG: hypothetical protein A2276_02015 [candidate division WOR-1 bacterium RIFOXYA12_FULL_43_27]OGC19502.1 MAG: hypothetical protein A2292_02315 [candidate division WOR-1 bacterium RIFOXYB2_FULL_46_45]OGC30490.1 MAG: hypothetical protein A2232_02315 [candidate division WOR-1 bacterium RIFOXYA2_FULL_46_56]OGC40558.1 MAG: hypothetical protein A2438_06030 [candidate division WOR-1 bacterium RIFOXYC2_FULL_46_14]
MSYGILLVDDDSRFRKEFVESFDEYSFVEAASGEEAIKALRLPNQVDLVVLDVMMPGERGTQTLKRIKKEFPRLPVIMLTGFSTKDVAIEALKGNADDYLEKPFNIEKTKSLLKKFLIEKKGGFDIDASDLKGKVEKVKEYILKNSDKKVTLEDAAKIIFFSPKYLSRAFSEIVGKGFNDFKLAAKIEKSKELLLNTGYSVEQVSEKLGYLNSESFIRIFKKNVKMTPAVFRKKKKKKI